MPLLIISEYCCPTTLLPLADTPPGCLCLMGLCSKEGWAGVKPCPCTFGVLITSALPCYSWKLCNPTCCHLLQAFWWCCCTHVRAVHTAHPQSCVKCCFLSSPEGGTVGRVWRSSLSWFLRLLKKYLFCNDHNKILFSFSFIHTTKHTPCPNISLEHTVCLYYSLLLLVSITMVFFKFPCSSKWKKTTTSLTFINAFLSC